MTKFKLKVALTSEGRAYSYHRIPRLAIESMKKVTKSTGKQHNIYMWVESEKRWAKVV